MQVEIAVQSNDILGEGPVWDKRENALYWVDIERKFLQRWDPISNERRIWDLHSNIGSFALRDSGGAVLAMRDGFHLLNMNDGSMVALSDPEGTMAYTRFNDGKCDRQGRFWAGTMDEEVPNQRAALYCLNKDLTYTKMVDGVGISNGLGWSPDDKIFYFTDSAEHAIFAYDFDIVSGAIANKRVFAKTPDEYVPDGLTVDSKGYIWSANWDGWKVIRYNPNGEIDLEIPLPVQRPTSCTFGGPQMDQLFITSARIGLEPEIISQQPLAGSVFRVHTQVSGIVEPLFSGEAMGKLGG